MPKKKRTVLAALVIAALLAGGAYLTKPLWINLPVMGRLGVGPPAAKDKARKVFYTCPMHTQIVRERPGDCPICGMTLVRKEQPEGGGAGMKEMSGMPGMEKAAPPAAAEAGLGPVTLDPRRRMLANVATAKAEVRSISEDVDTVGKVALDERAVQKVSARYAGRVERLSVNFTGQPVRKGQLIMSIYSPELIASEKEYLIAKGSSARLGASGFEEISRGAEGVMAAARTRLRLWGMTDAQIDELDKTGVVKETAEVYSPVSGTIMEIKARQGDYVSEGAEIYTVADLSRVWVLADIYEYEFTKVGLGSAVEVTADAYPGRTLRGRVAFMDPAVNPDSRTVKVRVELMNPGGLLKPEMFVNARIHSRPARGVVVPASAVLYTGMRNMAWVESAPGVFEQRELTLGLRSGDYYQVLSGLKAGETVVTQGGFLIDSEAQLEKGAGGGMAGMPGMEAPAGPAPKAKEKPPMPPMPGM